MRVLLACPYFVPDAGGIQRFVEDTARLMAERHGDEVMILSGSGGEPGERPLQPPVRRGSVNVRYLSGHLRDPRTRGLPIFVPTFVSGAGRAIRGFDPEVIHLTHDRWFIPNSQLARVARGRRLLFSPFFHPYEPRIGNAPLTWLNRRTLRRADHVHAPTRYESLQVERVYRVDPAKLSVIPLGVRADGSHTPAPFEARDIVLFVGRLHAVKGPAAAARAFVHAAPQLPRGVRFVAVGRDWGEWPQVERIAAEAGLTERFERINAATPAELLALYDRALVSVQPSGMGAFGYPIFESMARGTPVVTSSTPQSRELLPSGAILVPDVEPVAMGGHVARLAGDPDAWRLLSAAGAALVAQRYTADAMVDRLRDLYAAPNR